MALYQAFTIIAFFWAVASFPACLGDEDDVIQLPASSPELLDESSRTCTSDITRTGKSCRCDSPCRKRGGDNKVWCYIKEGTDEFHEYCCTSKCTKQYNLHSIFTFFRKYSKKSWQCDAGGVARVNCDPVINTMSPNLGK